MSRNVQTLLQQLVSYPSLSGEEFEIADYVEAWADRAGFPVGRVENNVYLSLGSGSTCLLLNSHLDIVPASGDHPYDPFVPVVEDGRVYGRGTVDAKASCAAMLVAASNLAEEGWQPENGKLVVALTACEETSRPRNGLQTLLPHLPELHGAVIGEPTGLEPCFSQKGLLILEVTARGVSAHAARPDRGTNAIVKAAADVVALESLTFDRIHAQLGPTTKAVTVIIGGSARNMIPESCSFVIDLRTTPAYTHAEITETVKNLLESEVKVSSERYVPTETHESSVIAGAVRAALPDAVPFGSPTVSDWAFLGNVPAVKLGPGDSRLSHTGRESISVDELKAAVSLYESIVRRFFELSSSNNGVSAHAVEERR